MKQNKRILVAPLDWGLGHATRCIPLIECLLNKKAEVMIASSGSALKLLQQQFPALRTFELSGYKPVYPANGGSMVWKMAAQLPKFIKTISNEQKETERLVQHEKIDVVISDNRYGCYSTTAQSVLIYHQLHLLMPDGWKWMEAPLNRFNRQQVKKFDACWVPAPTSGYFPALTDTTLPVRYIGFLSRFKPISIPKKFKVLALCSGPEPQRSVLEKIFTEALLSLCDPCLLVRGVVQNEITSNHLGENVEVVNYLDAENLNRAICESEIVIARSGYSTVMDLMKIGSRAILIPTPRQTEQEYIAATLMKQNVAFMMNQTDFNLKKALTETEKFNGFVNFDINEQLMEKVIESIL